MLIEESIWIRDTIKQYLNHNHFPLLNIGSSTQHFREIVQPHIYQHVFAPLKQENKTVIHLDMKMDVGVDLIGNLSDQNFRDSLKDKGINSVLCSNLLEHLVDPKPICNSILQLLKTGGLIIVTVPYDFPFHEDPIDTGLRPSIEGLHTFFPGTKIISAQLVKSQGSYAKDLLANKKYLAIMLCRLLMPFYKSHQWKRILNDFFNARKKYSATCILLEKI